MSLLEQTVAAFCDTLACLHSLPEAAPDAALFVLHQARSAPLFLWIPIHCATLAFSFAGLLSGGTFFHRLTPPRRAAQIHAWQNSRLGPCRDFIRFYSSLALLSIYSRQLASGART
jgi:hypothetical protein